MKIPALLSTTVLAEILTIGDELCRGEIVDTNSAWLADALWQLDVTVSHLTSCRDEKADIRAALRLALSRTDLVLCSGGLGATLDDRTVDVVCELAELQAIVDPAAKKKQRRHPAHRVVHNADRQLRVPEGARVFANQEGLAPGFELPIEETPLICMPGIPRELKAIFAGGVREYIVELRERRGEKIERMAKRIYKTFGCGELQIANMVEGVEAGLAGITLGFQVKFPQTWLKVVVRHRSQESAHRVLAQIDARIRERLGPCLVAQDQSSLPETLGHELAQRKLTLATAESCTGGLIGAMLTEIPGSSLYYLGGSITYSNSEKIRQLGVPSRLLAQHGAVSEEIVLAMARACRQKTGADIAVAVSGIAGPSGGSEDKAVGTVWLAVATQEIAHARKLLWPGDRQQVQQMAAHSALYMVLELVRAMRVS